MNEESCIRRLKKLLSLNQASAELFTSDKHCEKVLIRWNVARKDNYIGKMCKYYIQNRSICFGTTVIYIVQLK